MSEVEAVRTTIEAAYGTDGWRADPAVAAAVEEAVDMLDRGVIRVAQPPEEPDGEWTVNAWVKQAVLMYFSVATMRPMEAGIFHWHDKVPLKASPEAAGFRAVPPATVRHGAFVERGAVLMPCYVNIGAWVGAGTMVDTWATVGSCAQIGAGVHLSGGVGIGGVLEPPGATPVIVEDGAFVGSRAIVVEGVRVGREAVLGANVVLTGSTKIIDVTGPEEVIHHKYVPPRSVVIPGTRVKSFPAGDYGVPCALIIGTRKESTNRKTSLNEVLREFAVSV